MDWKTTVASLDEVPEQYRSFYSREGDEGDYTLADEGISSLLNSIKNLNTTVRNIRNESKGATTLAGSLKAAGFETWDDVKARLDELETEANKAAGAEDRVARVKQDLEASHAVKLQEKDQRLSLLESKLGEQIVGRATLEAITEEKGKPKLLSPIVERRIKMVEEDGEFVARVIGPDGQPMLDGQGNYLSIRGYVSKLKADPDYGDAFEASGNNGTGSNPSSPKGTGGVNPFDPKTKNLTAAQELISTNPERARALAQQAGHPVNW